MPDNKLDTTIRDEVRKQVTQKIIGWLIAGIIALLGFAAVGWWFYIKPTVDAYIADVAEVKLTEILSDPKVVSAVIGGQPKNSECSHPGKMIIQTESDGINATLWVCLHPDEVVSWKNFPIGK
jgi:hypothetical protein